MYGGEGAGCDKWSLWTWVTYFLQSPCASHEPMTYQLVMETGPFPPPGPQKAWATDVKTPHLKAWNSSSVTHNVLGVCCVLAVNAPSITVDVTNMGQSKAGLWLAHSLNIGLDVTPSDPLYSGRRWGSMQQLNCTQDSVKQLPPWENRYTYMPLDGYGNWERAYSLPPKSTMRCVSSQSEFTWLPPGEVSFAAWVQNKTVQNVEQINVTLQVPRSPHLSLELKTNSCMASSMTGMMYAHSAHHTGHLVCALLSIQG